MPRDSASNIQTKDSVELCLDFFRAAVPTPTTKNVSTQIGCHFEEVGEMIDALMPSGSEAAFRLNEARHALHALAELMKANETAVSVANRVEFLDAVCDQMVTGIGAGHFLNMDVLGGFIEVNQSNLSKFDENGQPIFNENRKVMKGPLYKKAELEQFV